MLLMIDHARYEELIAAEERLCLLELAVERCNPYSGDLYLIKKIFDLEDEKGNEE